MKYILLFLIALNGIFSFSYLNIESKPEPEPSIFEKALSSLKNTYTSGVNAVKKTCRSFNNGVGSIWNKIRGKKSNEEPDLDLSLIEGEIITTSIEKPSILSDERNENFVPVFYPYPMIYPYAPTFNQFPEIMNPYFNAMPEQMGPFNKENIDPNMMNQMDSPMEMPHNAREYINQDEDIPVNPNDQTFSDKSRIYDEIPKPDLSESYGLNNRDENTDTDAIDGNYVDRNGYVKPNEYTDTDPIDRIPRHAFNENEATANRNGFINKDASTDSIDQKNQPSEMNSKIPEEMGPYNVDAGRDSVDPRNIQSEMNSNIPEEMGPYNADAGRDSVEPRNLQSEITENLAPESKSPRKRRRKSRKMKE